MNTGREIADRLNKVFAVWFHLSRLLKAGMSVIRYDANIKSGLILNRTRTRRIIISHGTGKKRGQTPNGKREMKRRFFLQRNCILIVQVRQIHFSYSMF